MRPWHSLRYRLPLLISLLLVVAVSALCALAYRQVQVMLIHSTSDRLTGATRELAAMLRETTRTMRRDAALVAADTALARVLERPSADTRAAATRVLERERDRSRTSRAGRSALALWSRSGERLMWTGPLPTLDGAPLTGIPEQAAGDSPHAWVAPLVRTDSGVMMQVVAPVPGASGKAVGFLVISRRLMPRPGSERMAGLIGADATFLLGNATGALWTDLLQVVPPPPAPVPFGASAPVRTANGQLVFGRIVRVPDTPWAVWVQIPWRSVAATARGFVAGIAGLGAFFIVLGALAAWLVSHRVTTPLTEVARAAEDVAGGDYTRRVASTRRDELGSLARSFNSMAAQVQAAAHDRELRAGELEAMNAELRGSEQRYRQLVELLPDAVLVHRDRCIRVANPAAVTLLGAGAEAALLGRSVLDFVPPAERAGLDRRMQQVQEDARATPLAERCVHRMDGTPLSVESASMPFVLDGAPAVLSVLRDLTERKELEAQFRQAQKMEAVGQLAGGVAHDFNNLLTVVTSYCALLLAELPTEAPARADVQQIAGAAQRAATLTRQLLAFGRQQVLEPRVVDANATVASLEQMLRRVLPANIHLHTALDPALGRVHVDPGQLEQVLLNLAVNARDAMPSGGTLHIATANVHLDARAAAQHPGAAPGPYMALAVRDTGVGMSAEQQARIFEPFYTTKEPGKGTGLGLSTVYGIVQQSGGHIAVRSGVGEGTAFTIYLPRVTAPVDDRTRTSSGAHRAVAGCTILLAEDEAPVRAVTRRILERAGYAVIEAGCGAEALERAARPGASFDLLLTDMVMPDMNGHELAARLRARDPALRVVFMSGYTEDAVLRQRMLEPDAVFVPKPFTPNGLIEKVRVALEGDAMVLG